MALRLGLEIYNSFIPKALYIPHINYVFFARLDFFVTLKIHKL